MMIMRIIKTRIITDKSKRQGNMWKDNQVKRSDDKQKVINKAI